MQFLRLVALLLSVRPAFANTEISVPDFDRPLR